MPIGSDSISTLEIINNNGRNAIHVAAMEGHLNIIKYLVDEQGCSPCSLDKYEYTPLHLAADEKLNDLHVSMYCCMKEGSVTINVLAYCIV